MTPLQVCRSCLEPSDIMYPLVGTIINVDVSIATMFEYCISAKLELNENLPRSICLQCFKTIRIAYLFLLQFHETQKRVNKLLIEPVEVGPYQEYVLPNGDEQILAELKMEDLHAAESSPQIEYEIQESDFSDDDNIEIESVVKNISQDGSLIKLPLNSVEYSSIYICPRCHTKFGQYLVFQRHILSYNLETITCTRCPDNHSFERDEYLAHYREMHRYECEICNKRMASHYGFQYHMKIHQSEKKYKCTFKNCTRSFLLNNVLKKHMLSHTEPKTYPCHLCDRVFKTVDMYRYHIRHHDGKKNFLCTYCGRTFMQAVHLRYHVSKHIGERTYKCELCGKSFLVKPALTKHFRGCMKKHKQKSDE